MDDRYIGREACAQSRGGGPEAEDVNKALSGITMAVYLLGLSGA